MLLNILMLRWVSEDFFYHDDETIKEAIEGTGPGTGPGTEGPGTEGGKEGGISDGGRRGERDVRVVEL